MHRLTVKAGLLAGVAVLAAGAVYAAVNSYISQEAESGTRTSLASAVSDSSASGGMTVKFGAENPDAPAGVFIT